jgi:hypothetical protein
VPEVSEIPAVQEARVQYEQMQATERYFLE